MPYEKDCSEILDLFRAAGKEVPHEDSDMGRAVQILQTICDSQSHSIPSPIDALEDVREELQESGWEIFEHEGKNYPYAVRPDGKGLHLTDPNLWQVIKWAADEQGIDTSCIASEIFEALEEIESHIGEDDFSLDFDGNEYRLISESDIWEIYRDEIQRIVEDCYSDVLKLDKIPSFIAVSVDWEQTAKNAYSDGYGHTFSSYDGSEEESAGYYIFRTN